MSLVFTSQVHITMLFHVKSALHILQLMVFGSGPGSCQLTPRLLQFPPGRSACYCHLTSATHTHCEGHLATQQNHECLLPSLAFLKQIVFT